MGGLPVDGEAATGWGRWMRPEMLRACLDAKQALSDLAQVSLILLIEARDSLGGLKGGTV